ncbi:multiple epidermal growth factor-like domains protein 10 [Saccostrea cucullata]|uniref:multiple epidermal growth factor-like domains protein 10 n=1 Tax=Saccostrea cuccullata TaxID=36930 RepID=UPI002ED685E3
MMSIIETFIFKLLSTSSFLCSFSAAIPICEKSLKGCCSNYKWNYETQQCEKCLPGYTGVNCNQTCPYPLYGVGCQTKCDCKENLCDASIGCRIFITDGQTFYMVSNLKESTVSMTENSTEVQVTRHMSSGVNNFLLILIVTLGCVDLLLIFAHSFVYIYIHNRRKRNAVNNIDTAVNYHRTNTTYENIDIDIPSTSGF